MGLITVLKKAPKKKENTQNLQETDNFSSDFQNSQATFTNPWANFFFGLGHCWFCVLASRFHPAVQHARAHLGVLRKDWDHPWIDGAIFLVLDSTLW